MCRYAASRMFTRVLASMLLGCSGWLLVCHYVITKYLLKFFEWLLLDYYAVARML